MVIRANNPRRRCYSEGNFLRRAIPTLLRDRRRSSVGGVGGGVVVIGGGVEALVAVIFGRRSVERDRLLEQTA